MSRQAKNKETAAPDLPHLCRQVAEQSSLPMAAVEGTEHIVCYVNPAFCRMLGRSSDELIGIPFARAVPEGKVCLPLLDRVSRTGEPQDHTEQDHPGSHPPHWSYAVWAIPGASTRPAGIMIQVRDATRTEQVRQQATGMTQELMLAAVRQHELLDTADRLSAGLQVEIGERKRTEEALRRAHDELEEKVWERTAELGEANAALRETTRTLRELIEAAPAGISVLDPEGKVLLWNPAMEKIYGWTVEEVQGKLFPTVTVGQEGAKEILERLLGGERLAGVELRRARKDGRPVELLLWTAPLREESGRLKTTVAIFLDVTLLKEMERVALVQQKMASLGQVAASIAHEIRNPLSGINLYLHSLETFLGDAEALDPETRQSSEAVIAGMKGASAQMEATIQRVLTFSRPGPPRMMPFDVNACIQETVDLTRVSLQKAGVQLAVALREDVPACFGDMRLVTQALLNLLANAAQAMEGQEGERRIEVQSFQSSASSRSGFVTVSVADSGPGVPEGLRNKIFDPFFTTRKEGTGIGLAITQKILSEHGGSVRVGKSHLGGALFTIGLPAAGTGKIPGADPTTFSFPA
jgi:PAS domain S-box-containing protein